MIKHNIEINELGEKLRLGVIIHCSLLYLRNEIHWLRLCGHIPTSNNNNNNKSEQHRELFSASAKRSGTTDEQSSELQVWFFLLNTDLCASHAAFPKNHSFIFDCYLSLGSSSCIKGKASICSRFHIHRRGEISGVAIAAILTRVRAFAEVLWRRNGWKMVK